MMSNQSSEPSLEEMPEDVVLSARHVSKKFCRNLKRSMLYGMRDLGCNLLGVGVGGGYDKKDAVTLRPDEFWAVRDMSFDLHRGERLGIIGANGCGKTTLLRILNGIFPPDEGVVMLRGRIGALIALGAGFHPHYTGRENVYLNAAILGMTREEIDSKFEDIVRFSELGPFIDAPVATYSSGMGVRLGFSIAAFTEPDIMLIDEVLAVGDMSFRAKCSDRIREMCNRGVAVVFVAHDMVAVQALCERVLWIDHGQRRELGPAAEVIADYMDEMDRITVTRNLEEQKRLNLGTGHIDFVKVVLRDGNGMERDSFRSYDSLSIELHYHTSERLVEPYFWVGIGTDFGSITGANMLFDGHRPDFVEGDGKIVCHFGPLPLMPQVYRIYAGIRAADGMTGYIQTRQVAMFRIDTDVRELGFSGDVAVSLTRLSSPVFLPYSWEFEDGRKFVVDPARNHVTAEPAHP